MIFTWVLVVVIALIGMGLSIHKTEKRFWTAVAIVVLILTIAMCGGLLWYLYCTEAGKRTIKDTKSNISGGIERTITVYDFDGDVIEKYSGKFDVDYDSKRIKFDDEDGKRHVIYYTTGTVIIDED